MGERQEPDVGKGQTTPSAFICAYYYPEVLLTLSFEALMEAVLWRNDCSYLVIDSASLP